LKNVKMKFIVNNYFVKTKLEQRTSISVKFFSH
jgi:hypothetical protein